MAQFYMGSGEDGVFGPATAVSLNQTGLNWATTEFSLDLGYLFSIKFHRKVGRFWPLYLFLAVIAFVLALPFLEDKDTGWNYHWISLCSASFVWFMIFGLVGFFRKLFSRANLKVRFISDSSYWLYIAHLPLIQIIQFWVSEWSLPSFIKLIFVCIITTILLLLSYRYLIRYSPIGTMLNGKRYKSYGTN